MDVYEIYEVLETGERVYLDSCSEDSINKWLEDESGDLEHFIFVKESGRYMEIIAFGKNEWDIINRGVNSEYLEEKRSFRSYKKSTEKTIRHASKDKPIDQRKHHLKTNRGINRKRQSYVPLYRQIEHADVLPTAQNILKNAKKAHSGVWRLSGRQVVEIAQKYKFNPPDERKKSKHLGSTGILMWRKSPKEYYLVKFSKHRIDPTKRHKR